MSLPVRVMSLPILDWPWLATGPLPSIGVWLLVGILLWSGTVKVRHPRLAASAMVDFGVIRVPRRLYGSLLGGAELGLALLLITIPLQGLLATSGILWIFTGAIARSLLHGKRFACFCFGDNERPLSRVTLGRTSLLAILATLLLLCWRDTALLSADVSNALALVIAGAMLGMSALIGTALSILRRDPSVDVGL